MLRVENLHFRHRSESTDTLSGISFEAQKGAVTTVLGPNGSGKTTLFRCISGLWEHSSGEIYFDGKPVDRHSFSRRARIFSLVFQEHEPAFPYTVFDIVLMGRASYVSIFSSPRKKDYEIAERSLKMLGIEHLKVRPYTKISGGERQLTLIARAVAQDTPCLLLDEPTSHLDFRNQISVLKKIREICKEKALVVIMSLHDPNLAALFSDKVIVMNSGKKVADGRPDEIISEELIKKVYGIDVKKGIVDGRSLICPVP